MGLAILMPPCHQLPLRSKHIIYPVIFSTRLATGPGVHDMSLYHFAVSGILEIWKFPPIRRLPTAFVVHRTARALLAGWLDLPIRVIFLLGGDFMKIQASFVPDGKWWVAWTDDVPGALTQGATLGEARENLIDAVRMMRQPVDLSKLPKNKIVIEQLEV
jgi:hypothetical protein